MLKETIKKWNDLQCNYPSCASEAVQQVTKYHPDGTPKTDWDYYSDLVWVTYGIISSGGEHSC